MSNEGYGASLELHKLYRVVPDKTAETQGLIRIVDESGEDYLYPKEYFREVVLPASVQTAVTRRVAPQTHRRAIQARGRRG